MIHPDLSYNSKIYNEDNNVNVSMKGKLGIYFMMYN